MRSSEPSVKAAGRKEAGVGRALQRVRPTIKVRRRVHASKLTASRAEALTLKKTAPEAPALLATDVAGVACPG